MEIRQIQYFIQICRDKSILKASQNLYVSQQALSKAMQNLERELGVPLFTRSNSGIEMTKYGGVFFRKAVHILSDLEGLSRELDDQKDKYTDKLTMGFTVNTLKQVYLDTIWTYQDRHKSTKVSFVETSDLNCAQMIVAEQLDLACVSGVGSVDPAFFDYFLMRQDAPWLAISADNPLSERETITIADLAGENFLMGSSEFGHFHELIEVCRTWGFYPRTDYLSDDIHTLIELVALNKGAYILPENRLEDMKRPNVRFFLLEDIPPVKYYLITKKGRYQPAGVKAFSDLLIEKVNLWAAESGLA
jgi:DNA-binding transcriptional LysR family regulator